MKENIRDIFEQNIKLLGVMDKSVYYFREQQYDLALGLVADSIDQIKFIIEAIIKDREYFNLVATESMLEMLTGILDAKKNGDFVLLADLLELQLINFLLGVQELIISKEEILFDEESYKENINLLMESGAGFPEILRESINTAKLLESGYRVEFTSCGQMTLATENEGAKFYFHTNNKIQTEAFLLAKHWYQENITRYILYGLGMGYHVDELQSIAKKAEIVIYESDLHVVQLACAFSNIKVLLQNKRIKVVYDPELILLNEKMESMAAEEKVIVHYPSYKNIRNQSAKEKLFNEVSWSKAIEVC